MAAAVAMKREGIGSPFNPGTDAELGGILNQCIHSGFGLHTFHEELTGPGICSALCGDGRHAWYRI